MPGFGASAKPRGHACSLLRPAFTDFASYPGELQPHFACGLLSHADYAQAHVRHPYNRLIRLA